MWAFYIHDLANVQLSLFKLLWNMKPFRQSFLTFSMYFEKFEKWASLSFKEAIFGNEKKLDYKSLEISAVQSK